MLCNDKFSMFLIPEFSFLRPKLATEVGGVLLLGVLVLVRENDFI